MRKNSMRCFDEKWTEALEPHPILGTKCWLWAAGTNHDGYGQLRLNGKRPLAHCASYAIHVGPIPTGLQLDHLCRVRHCVNPAHLEAVTSRENILRGNGFSARNATRTHCPQGHPYSDENTFLDNGGRRCRKCSRDKNRRSYAKKRLVGITQ